MEIMMTLTPEQTVGEIAAGLPASVRIFEKHQIDFCCGGRIPLTEACKRQGLDPAAVLEEIAGANAPASDATDWQSAPLPGLIDYIISRHHDYLKAELPRLEAMLQKILTKHGERYGDVLVPLAATFRAMAAELSGHLMKEEMVLFPLVRAMASGGRPVSHCGSIGNPISVMLAEHDSAGDALTRLRALTGGYVPPADACNTFRAFYYELSELEQDLHRHIHLENNILFPRALALQQ